MSMTQPDSGSVLVPVAVAVRDGWKALGGNVRSSV